MSAPARKRDPSADLVPPFPDVELAEEDGEPMETTWHRDQMVFLIEQIRHHWRDRRDYFVGGNQFIYFDLERARKQNFRGPDFFVAKGVAWDPQRRYYVVWEEGGKYPHFILELLSEKTKRVDRTTKKTVYQDVFRTPEYVLYDPDTNKLEGLRLKGLEYERIVPDARGWLWSEQLQLWIGKWEGEFQGCQATWIRFHDADGNPIATFAEAERQRAEAAEAEIARLKRAGKRKPGR